MSSQRFAWLPLVPALVSLWPIAAHAADSDVRVNSVAYVTGHAKHASVSAAGTAFTVNRATDNSVAFTGTLAAAAVDESGDSVQQADFTALNEEGKFYLNVAGVGKSATFAIGRDGLHDAFVASMLGFYGWRCNTAVSLSFAGQTFAHAACHMDDAHTDYIGATGRRDGFKGWHDAGDYGKYVVNAGITVGSMLAAWEQFPDGLAKIKLPIPESGNGTPDYLSEIRWELEWVLTMQYGATDGRVSHKLTSINFDGDAGWKMPEFDTQTRYFVPYGTAATADLVAMLAKAARIYQPYDAAFAKTCLDAAKVSYAYLVANPADVSANQAGFNTGGYGTSDPDDRLWAAAEMWETTGDAAALADFEARANKVGSPKVKPDFDWGDVTNLGMLTYLRSARTGRDESLVYTIKVDTINTAHGLVGNATKNGYGRALGSYYWGSNGSVGRSCMVLMTANEMLADATFPDTCMDQVGWLLGRNHYNRSFVTGLGINPPMHPHHRPSQSDGITPPWPGLLVGGGHAATDWVDDWTNYSVNEVAINWNAGLVYALAAFQGGSGFTPDGGAPDGGSLSDAGAGGSGQGAGGGANGTSTSTHGAAGSGGGAGTSANSKGCGCRIDGEDPGPATGAVISGIALAALALRRRRRSA